MVVADIDITRECAVAADWVVSVLAHDGCPERRNRESLYHIENLRFDLIRYFLGCLRSKIHAGYPSDRWGAVTLAMVFPGRWERRIKQRIRYVSIRPGEVGVRPRDGRPTTIRVAPQS